MKYVRDLVLLLIFFICFEFHCNATLIFSDEQANKKIVIFGAGYVGAVTGACLADLGHHVIFIDPNEDKVKAINSKKSPILEPQLEQLICKGVESNLIQAKQALRDEIQDADVVMIAVPTPTSPEGKLQTQFLENVFFTISQATQSKQKALIIVMRSTVSASVLRQLFAQYFDQSKSIVSLVANPEFLRESTAVKDFFNPPFCVVGGDDEEAKQIVLSLYNTKTKKIAVSLETACLLKYACNAFHALKITFANEIASICESLEMSPVELMRVFCEDKTLNCSTAYLKPGFSFGGSCLSKDLRALVALGNYKGCELPLLTSILPSNENRFQKKADEILSGNHKRVAVLGISFKKNSDDMRESPFLKLIEYLYSKGLNLQIYDPDTNLGDINGSTQKFFREHYSHLMPLVKFNVDDALSDCDGVVVCKDILGKEYFSLLRFKEIPIYDLQYIYPYNLE